MSDESDKESPEPTKDARASDRGGTVKRPPGSKRPEWWLLAAVAVALIAGIVAGMAIIGWLRPSSGGSAHFSDQQVTDAKKDVCAAALLARQAVAKNTHLKNPDPDNPVAQLAVAANARLSLAGGAAYLRGRLEANPAAPQDVTEAASAMAGSLEQLNISYLVAQSNSVRDKVGHELDSHIAELGKLCE